MKNLPKISEAEYEVMEIIWNNYPISTSEVVDILSQKTQWSPKTIQTLLSRLIKKEVLIYEKKGRSFVYTPRFDKEQYVNQESKSFLNKFFGGTLNSMVLHFLEEDDLTDDDISDLKNILNKKGNQRRE